MQCSSLFAAAALSVAFAAANALAQDTAAVARKTTFLRVVAADGSALPGAVVTLAGGMPHLGPLVGPTDLQIVVADARGRAQCKLLPGLCYVAWAATAKLQSTVAAYFGAGAILELHCDEPVVTHQVQCTGTAAWAELGPLRFFAATPFPGHEEELALQDDGKLVVPPGPFSTLEVRTRIGEPLWSVTLPVERIQLPPPQALIVHAVDEAGAPLDGVVIRHRVARRLPWRFDGYGGVADGLFRDLGTTVNGRVTVVVPYATHPALNQDGTDLLLFGCAKSRPAVAGGVFGRALYQDDRRVANWRGGELLFTCRRVESLRGKLPVAPAGTIAHLAGVCKLQGDRTSFTHDARSFVTTVAADGTFEFLDVPAELHSSRLQFVTANAGEPSLPLLPATAGRELPAEIAIESDPGRAMRGYPGSAALHLRTREPDGGPSRGVVAFVVPAELQGVLVRDSLIRVPLDAAGAARLQLLPGPWLLLVVSATGHAAVRLDLERGERDYLLELQPLARTEVVLRDRLGQPIAGARLQWRGSQTRASGDPLEFLQQGYSTHLRKRLGSLRTDNDGRMSICYLPVNGVTYQVELVWPGGASPVFSLEPTEAPTELRPR